MAGQLGSKPKGRAAAWGSTLLGNALHPQLEQLMRSQSWDSDKR